MRSRGSPQEATGEASIGALIRGDRIETALVSPGGEILSSHRHPFRTGGRHGRAIELLASCVRHDLGDGARTAKAIGVGLAGSIRESGSKVTAPALAWRDVALVPEIEQSVHRPTFLTSGARAATLAEWQFGAGRAERDLVCVFVGDEVGGGVVIDGRLQHGSTGAAGEIGHLTVETNGRTCYCSNSGCLEAYVGGWAIGERAREASAERSARSGPLKEVSSGAKQIAVESIVRAYRSGDPVAQKLLEETVEYLTAGLVSALHAFNPSLLILGGSTLERLPSLVPATEALVRRKALTAATERLRIVRATLGEDAGVRGAATMANSRASGVDLL